MSSPLVKVPFRQPDYLDFEPLKTYIKTITSEDFSGEVATLNRYRQDLLDVAQDMSGRDIIYRYYGQLELIDLRFPMDQVSLSFSWRDAFSGQRTEQSSIAFEKASVIFNLSAVCSAIASSQNRHDLQGLKVAFNYYQASAGSLQFISDNFLHAPSKDMSRESIKVLVDLMLAQAQECFLEKVLLENKKGNLVSKLAAHLAFLYSSVLDGMNAIKSQFESSWFHLMTVKVPYFYAIAYYHKYIAAQESGSYGLALGYITSAETSAKEASKHANAFNLTSLIVSWSFDSKLLIEITNTLSSLISAKKAVAVKDNDTIYHQSLPSSDELVLEKLNAVKPIPFIDLLPNGQADVPVIVGKDLFHRLIPVSVHQADSVYTEEKAKLLRQVKEKVETSNVELASFLKTINLSFKKPDLSFAMEMWSHVSHEEQSSPTQSFVQRISQMRPALQHQIETAKVDLDGDLRECEQYRIQYQQQWSQTTNAPLRQQLMSQYEALEKAKQTDTKVFEIVANLGSFISLFSGDFSLIENSVQVTRKNVMDEPLLNDQVQIEKINGLISRCKNLEKERNQMITQLSQQIQSDDISSVLVFQKGNETKVFETELSKFKPTISRIQETITTQLSLVQDLTRQYDVYKSSPSVLQAKIVLEKTDRLSEQWKRDYQLWKECRESLYNAISFYTELSKICDGLKLGVATFLGQRRQERQALVAKLERDKVERDQYILRTELSKLTTNPTPTPMGTPPIQNTNPMTYPTPTGNPLLQNTTPMAKRPDAPSFMEQKSNPPTNFDQNFPIHSTSPVHRPVVQPPTTFQPAHQPTSPNTFQYNPSPAPQMTPMPAQPLTNYPPMQHQYQPMAPQPTNNYQQPPTTQPTHSYANHMTTPVQPQYVAPSFHPPPPSQYSIPQPSAQIVSLPPPASIQRPPQQMLPQPQTFYSPNPPYQPHQTHQPLNIHSQNIQPQSAPTMYMPTSTHPPYQPQPGYPPAYPPGGYQTAQQPNPYSTGYPNPQQNESPQMKRQNSLLD